MSYQSNYNCPILDPFIHSFTSDGDCDCWCNNDDGSGNKSHHFMDFPIQSTTGSYVWKQRKILVESYYRRCVLVYRVVVVVVIAMRWYYCCCCCCYHCFQQRTLPCVLSVASIRRASTWKKSQGHLTLEGKVCDRWYCQWGVGRYRRCTPPSENGNKQNEWC